MHGSHGVGEEPFDSSLRRGKCRGRELSQGQLQGFRWEMSGWEWVEAREEGGVSGFFIHSRLTGVTGKLDGGGGGGERREGESGMTPGLSPWKTQLVASPEIPGDCPKTQLEEE